MLEILLYTDEKTAGIHINPTPTKTEDKIKGEKFQTSPKTKSCQ